MKLAFIKVNFERSRLSTAPKINTQGNCKERRKLSLKRVWHKLIENLLKYLEIETNLMARKGEKENHIGIAFINLIKFYFDFIKLIMIRIKFEIT